MNFDINEIIRQKQLKHQQRINVENGDPVDITIGDDGEVVISHVVPQEVESEPTSRPPRNSPAAADASGRC